VNPSEEAERRIIEKAEYVEDALVVLARKQSLDESAYRENREQRAIVEREFQTAIEACIDIAGILIRSTDESMPKTNAGRFSTLEELDVLTAETADRMRKAAGFRNVLVHTYGDEIDDEQVYRHLQTELESLVTFLREIRESLGDP